MKVDLAQEQFQRIVESSLDGIIIIQDGRPVYANPAALSTFRYESSGDLQSIRFVDLMAPASRPFTFHDPEGYSLGDSLKQNEEIRALTKEGTILDLEVNARVVEWNGRQAVQASFRDVTERKKLERDQARWLWDQETLTTIDRQLVAMIDLQNVLDAISHHAKA
ncbi:MAG: PAS domain S-box protein, partial [Ignavibacteriales bacterium]|nr:PAS domain S-box protein [Ignavibacteriales bacterium]